MVSNKEISQSIIKIFLLPFLVVPQMSVGQHCCKIDFRSYGFLPKSKRGGIFSFFKNEALLIYLDFNFNKLLLNDGKQEYQSIIIERI